MKLVDIVRNFRKNAASIGIVLLTGYFGCGQGGCGTMDINDFNAVSYGTLSNIEARKGNYGKATGYSAMSQLSAIAGQRNYETDQAEANRQTQLKAAQTIADATSAQNSGNTYVVKSGDSISSISFRHGVHPRELAQANGINKSILRVGQKLNIPVASNNEIKDQMINTVESKKETVPIEKYKTLSSSMLTCNYWIDLNTNDIISYKELCGVKTRFYEGEEIKIVAMVNRCYGQTYTLKVWGPNGKNVYDVSRRIPEQSKVFGVGGDEQEDWTKEIREKGGLGSYKAAAYVEGVFKDSCEFTIEKR